MGDARNEFAEFAVREPIALDRGALLIARQEYPELDIGAYLARLDRLADKASPLLAGEHDVIGRVQALSRFLFEEQGFAGNRQFFGDPRNSFLNEVLDRKLGIPISLAVVYLEVGRRLGLGLEGIGFPGHFLVKALAQSGDLIVDPFNAGKLLTSEHLSARLQQTYGQAVRLVPEMLRAASPRQILTRMLRNLKNTYVAASDWTRALAALDRILMLEPQSLEDLLERAKLYEMLECFKAALDDLSSFLRIAPRHALAEPAREAVARLAQQVARIS